MINLKNIKPDVRYLKDMKDVVYDKEWFKKAPKHMELYYMYRGVKNKGGLRYDITIIPAKMLGKEFVKTKGHQHLKCQETYTILKGEAIFLIQKAKGKNIKKVFAIKAKKGDDIAIPPEHDHVTINPGSKELKLANWISEKSKHDYSHIKKSAGACYFYTKEGWIKNKNYTKVPKLRASGGTGRRATFRALSC